MSGSAAPMSPEKLAETITADNARELLAYIGCPYCDGEQTLDLFCEPNNNSVGIVCRGCGTKHPLNATRRIMWLRHEKQKRSNDIVAVIKECGAYCYGCGNDFETLRQRGIGRHVHHTRPFSKHGEKYPKIPMCALCHELVSAAQRHVRKLLAAGQQTPIRKPNGGLNGG
jgi:hypothetical protein